MDFMIPPVMDHWEPNPEQMRLARRAVIKYLRRYKIDQGVTTAVVLTVYDQEDPKKKHFEIRGTTNPLLKRFGVTVEFHNDGSVTIEEGTFDLRPAYDPRRARGRAKKK